MFFAQTFLEIPGNFVSLLHDIPLINRSSIKSKKSTLYLQKVQKERNYKERNCKQPRRVRMRNSETSMKEVFVTIVNYCKALTIVSKNSILNVARVLR